MYSVIPFFLTVLSSIYIHYAPTVVGNFCGPNGNELCYLSLPGAGFPFAYWIDQGRITGMGQVGFEDTFSALAFGADFIFYVLVVLFIDIFIQRWRRHKAG